MVCGGSVFLFFLTPFSLLAVFDSAQKFNQDVSTWDVSKVTSMVDMFHSAFVFNQDVSKWNTGAVTTMEDSKCTSLSLFEATPSIDSIVVFFNIRQLEFHRITILTRSVVSFCFSETVLCCCFGGLLFLCLLYPLLQCLRTHGCSIKTCQNGILVR